MNQGCKGLLKSLKEIDTEGLFARITLIASRPQDAWEVIKGELLSIQEIYIQHLLIIVLLSSFFECIDFMVKAGSFSAFGPGVMLMLAAFITKMAMVYVFAMLLEFLAKQPMFGSEAGFMSFFKLVTYPSIIGLLGNIFSVVPYINYPLMILASFYGGYFLYLGLETMIGIVDYQKRAIFLGLALVVMCSIVLIFNILIWRVPLAVLF